MHTSKFAAFVSLKIVVCIGSEFFEDVFGVRLVSLGCRRGSGDIELCKGSGGEKANLFYIRSRSASRTSRLITNIIMVPILQNDLYGDHSLSATRSF